LFGRRIHGWQVNAASWHANKGKAFFLAFLEAPSNNAPPE
jgi:hypothetical protein